MAMPLTRAVGGRDDEAVFVVGDGHDVVHVLDFGLAHLHLFEHGMVGAPVDMLGPLPGAHGEHALERAHYRHGIAGREQVGEVLHRDAQLADVRNLAIGSHMPGVSGSRDG